MQTAYNDLLDLKQLALVCDDCGRRRIWRRDTIARAQLRWRVRTVAQIGSRAVCNHCSSRGQGGYNVSVYVDEVEPVEHADARRSLDELQAVTSTCADCGHTRRLDRAALDELTEVKTYGQLWEHAFCPDCRAAGARKPNVVLTAEWKGGAGIQPAGQAGAVAWSQKEVFPENRDDPFPQLPPSRLMRRA